MTTFIPIIARDQYDFTEDYDEVHNESDVDKIQDLLLGRSVRVANSDHLQLDDGTVLKLVGNVGGCSCGAGDYDLTELNGTENIITSVDFDYEPGNAHSQVYEGHYSIFVFADAKRINLATFDGTDGNGYYGTGYRILVRHGGPDTAGAERTGR